MSVANARPSRMNSGRLGPSLSISTTLLALFLCDTAPAQLFSRLRNSEVVTSENTYPRIDLAPGYLVDPTWPAKEQGGEWGAMSGLCLDHDGKVWAFHRGVTPVMVYDDEGHRLSQWGEGQFGMPHQVRIDRLGHVWLADAGLHVVREFTDDGQLLRTLGTLGEPGDDSTHFNQPTDVAIVPSGDIYVADGYGNNRIVHFDPEGRFVREWGKLGSAPGEFSLPHAIAHDSRGRLYVADRNNARVQVFDPDGGFIDEWTGLIVPWHVVVTERDEVYVCGSTPMRWPRIAIPGVPLGIPPKDQVVMVFSTDGRLKRLWSFPLGRGSGQVDWLHAMAVDPKGNLYLGDIKGQRAQRFLRLDADTDGPLADRNKVDPAVKRTDAPSTPD